MTDVLEGATLLRLVEVLRWPRVQLGALAIAGEGAWRAALDAGGTPSERRALLRTLERALLSATAPARDRLAAWENADGGVPLDRVLTATEISGSLLCYGDRALCDVVIAALARLPTAVRCAIVTEVAVLTVGRECPAWTANARLLDHAGDGPRRLIVVSGAGPDDQVERLVLHEAAHCWLAAQPHESSAALTVQGERALYRMAAADGWAQRVFDTIAEDELLADALAEIWSAP